MCTSSVLYVLIYDLCIVHVVDMLTCMCTSLIRRDKEETRLRALAEEFQKRDKQREELMKQKVFTCVCIHVFAYVYFTHAYVSERVSE